MRWIPWSAPTVAARCVFLQLLKNPRWSSGSWIRSGSGGWQSR